jgi:cytochrome c-type biogenesis protein CcmH/NrfG
MNLDAKIEIFTRRLAQDPHSRVFAPLADLLRQTGRLQDALDLLEDGVARHPNYVSALVIKGQTLLDAGLVDQARVVLAGVMELDSENILVLRLLTDDARNRQAWKESIPLLEKLVVLETDDDHWPSALAEAKRFAEREVSAQPEPIESLDTDFATMTLVDIYLAQGYREKALAALSQMAAREPGREDILMRIAEIEGHSRSVPSGLTPPAIPSGIPSTSPENPGNNYAARRNNEKKQFEDWITRLRQEGGPSS